MKKTSLLILLGFLLAFLNNSCNKKGDTDIKPVYSDVDLPRHELRHGDYFSIPYHERSIELSFAKALDSMNVASHVVFSDAGGTLNHMIEIVPASGRLILALRPGHSLKQGWKYMISFTDKLKYADGTPVNLKEDIECRTTIGNSIMTPAEGNRNSIAIISDVHMGDPRAYSNNYCWFGKNREALESFLTWIHDSSRVKELVILGDLFDEWLVPYTISPFDTAVNISSTHDFFMAVAGAATNKNIFDLLNEIANHDSIDLVYVPGNHDMLGTEEILHAIIPNARWMGGPDGLGKYSPFPEMVFEHGHRYDFFNCPQPKVNPGHKLPPGYFVSRLYAKGMMNASATDIPDKSATGSFEFRAAWDVAFLYTIAHFGMPMPDINAQNIIMSGIDGYSSPMSFNGAEEMYAASIEDYWPSTQAQNQVPVPTPCCFHAIWNGHSDLFSAAEEQYMLQPPAPDHYEVIAFGHTHEPMLKYYAGNGGRSSIYANSGSWIDADQSDYKVRTFVLVTPQSWTGSEIDVVGLYQYNLGQEGGYRAELLSEENID